MIQEAEANDASRLETYLSGFPATTMFLRGNLAAHGVGWTEEPHSTRYFFGFEDGSVTAVFGVTRNGFLLAEASNASPQLCSQFAKVIPEYTVSGMTGQTRSVEMTLSALGLSDVAFEILRDDPLLFLELEHLPSAVLGIRRPTSDDIGLLTEWCLQYELDTGLSASETEARASVAGRMPYMVQPGSSVRIGVDKSGKPCAMAALNASVADVAQVGGVFVPKPERNHGLGRQVTTALLAEVKEKGITQALLFAASKAAERAYQAIGFRNIGMYRVVLFAEPQKVGGTVA